MTRRAEDVKLALRMAKKSRISAGKNTKRKKYSKPRLTRHGELSKTALAHSY